MLQRTYNHRLSDFALEFYSFVADKFAPFYSTTIECTDRDAAYVLDGLLYNERELALENTIRTPMAILRLASPPSLCSAPVLRRECTAWTKRKES